MEAHELKPKEEIHEGCGGVLETHCETDITAAGVIREYWQKCSKCGGIFDPFEPKCDGCAKKIDHYCWDRGGQFWAGESSVG